jgi:hypothetical protein
MGKIEGLVQYEVEVQKNGTLVVIVLWVSMNRGARGKKKIIGEAYAKTPDQPQIYFRVTNGTSEGAVYNDFLRLLVFRGYLPLRFRTKFEGKFRDWESVSLVGLDVEEVLEHEGRAPS